ncbi:MAG: S8 family serine peptidase, partial [Microcystaceae cyanobacterium]
SGTTADAIRALEYAIEMGVHITNNSWGGGSYSQPLYDAISAAGDAGQLFIAAAGNDGKDNDSDDHYPSNYDLDNIISVASTDRYDHRSSFSNYGATSVDLGAPGSGILSTSPGGRYGTKNGTSMATPMVTGVASLIWGINPDLTATEVKQIILDNVDPLTRLQGKTVSGGRLNAYNALQNTPLPSTYEIEVGSGDTITDIDFGNHFINEPPELVGQSFEIPENSANGTVIGTIVATDPDQDSLTYQITQNIDIDGDGNNAFGLDGNQIIVNDRDDLDYEINPSLPITLQVSDGQLTAQALVTINLSNVNENPTPSSPKLHNEILTNIGSEWQTINLPYSYDSMVVVATPNYDSSDLPAVVRIRQAEGSQLEIKVQNPSNTPLSGYTIHLLVLEEGVYTEEEHGFTLEAGRFNSTVTDGKTSGWNGQSISPQNNYQNPVVFGSVMTSNDQDWSSFWSRGDVFNNPADSNHIYLGKHIAADTDTTRQDETLGYVIFESGTGTIEGQKFSAQLGSDSIEGVDNNSDSQYNLSNLGFTPQVALASQSAMDGGDGGWAILAGDNPINSHRLKLQIDEDQIEDSERRHTTEQVSYLLFEEKTDTSNSAPIINAQDINDVPENTANNTVIGTIIATDPDGDALTYQITENIDIDGDGENAFRLEGNQIIVNDSDDLDYETNPSLPITLQVSDGRLTAQALVTINLSDVDENPTPSSPKLHTEVLSNIGSNWQTINLPYSYDSMVVVATPNYDSSDLPAVVRIRQAQGNQLEIKVQNPSDTPLSGYNIHLLVIEEGAYSQAQHGFTLEAGRFNSTVTDGQTSGWNGQSISPQNNYQNPVVLGSVMTNNDQDWSSFWSRGDVVTNPADGNNIYLGKHIGEDTDTTRQDETLGYVIFESGTGTIEGQKLSAQLGSDSILGVDNSESHYDLSHLDFTPQVALVSQSAMDGGNGGWAILAGDNPISPTNLHLQIDEDQIRDSERLHTDEPVSYILFGEVTQTSLANSPALEPQFSEINQIMGTDEDDQLMGTSAADLFVLNPDHSGVDTINDFELGKDQIGLPNSLSYGSLEITSSGSSDTLISHETQALAILTMINPTDLMADDFLPVAI